MDIYLRHCKASFDDHKIHCCGGINGENGYSYIFMLPLRTPSTLFMAPEGSWVNVKADDSGKKY